MDHRDFFLEGCEDVREGSVTVKTNLRSPSKSRSQRSHPLINLSRKLAECIHTAIGWLWIAFWRCGKKCSVTNNLLCVEHIKHLNGIILINFHNNPMDLCHYPSFHLWNEASEQSRKVMQLLHSFVTEMFWFTFLPESSCVQSLHRDQGLYPRTDPYREEPPNQRSQDPWRKGPQFGK